MLNCPECGKPAFEGSLFCPECGATFKFEDEKRKTDSIPFVEETPNAVEPPLVGKGSIPISNISTISIIIPSSGRRIKIPLKEQLRIGRTDQARGIDPDVDLSEDDGAQAGISRLHASIISTSQGIAIMDLNSVNGTRVNGFQIPPNLPYALNSGDEVKLGDLLIHVFFEG
ncbi:MAG: FHA domain-containing protein [Anaerolineales bacterium]|nr:FHA domain-containing protein [Anaerolineales bacterium]